MNKCFFVVLALFTISSCSTEEDLKTNATILDYDKNRCVCCGGLIVKTESGKVYQSYAYPQKISPDVKLTFPYEVKIEFKHIIEGCSKHDGIIEIISAEVK
jgi:hypothetical protein